MSSSISRAMSPLPWTAMSGPLIVPVTLIRHYVRKFQVPYLLDQVYLSPHPHELMLLNHL